LQSELNQYSWLSSAILGIGIGRATLDSVVSVSCVVWGAELKQFTSFTCLT
jgi:hypothetical protein